MSPVPVGVFDSGVGGLSVLRAIREALPGQNLLYLADSGHAPYGERDSQYIAARAVAMTEFLLDKGIQALVIACHTATVTAVAALRSWCPVPIIAMEPAIKPAAAMTRSGVIGVLATSRTLGSATVVRLCALYGERVKILLQPCPGLVEQVERGELSGAVTRALVGRYIDPLLEAGADTLVLGCTHYPFLLPLIQEVAGPSVALVDPAAAVARELRRRLYGTTQIPLPPSDTPATERFFSSSPPARAGRLISGLWGRRVGVEAFDGPADAVSAWRAAPRVPARS